MADINLTGDANPLIKALEAAGQAFLKFDKTTNQIAKNQARFDRQAADITLALGRLAGGYELAAIRADRLATSIDKINKRAAGGAGFKAIVKGSGEAAASIILLETSLSTFAQTQVAAGKFAIEQAQAFEATSIAAFKAADAQAALRTSHLRGIAATNRATKTARLAAEADLAAAEAASVRAVANRRASDNIPGRGFGALGIPPAVPSFGGRQPEARGVRQPQLLGPAVLNANEGLAAATLLFEKLATAEAALTTVEARLTTVLQARADAQLAAERGLSADNSIRRLKAVRGQVVGENLLTDAIARQAQIDELRFQQGFAVRAATNRVTSIRAELTALETISFSEAERVARLEAVSAASQSVTAANQKRIATEIELAQIAALNQRQSPAGRGAGFAAPVQNQVATLQAIQEAIRLEVERVALLERQRAASESILLNNERRVIVEAELLAIQQQQARQSPAGRGAGIGAPVQVQAAALRNIQDANAAVERLTAASQRLRPAFDAIVDRRIAEGFRSQEAAARSAAERLNRLREAGESVAAANRRRLETERELSAQQARVAGGRRGGVADAAGRLNAVRQQNSQLLSQEGTLGRIAREFRNLAGLNQTNTGIVRTQTAQLEGQVPVLEQILRLTRLIGQGAIGGGVAGGGGGGGGGPGTPGFNVNLERGVGLFKRMGAAITDMGRLVGISLVIGSAFRLVQALEDSVRAAIDLEEAIAEVQTIDTARVATDAWADSLTELANAFGIDVLDQAEAAYQALSNQVVTGATATSFLTAANKLAVTAVTDVSAATNLLTAALNAFNIDAARAEEVASIFFKTVELGRVRIDEMAESFGRIAVPANQIGVSLEELTAAIATTTINGVKFNEASTLVRNVILKLIRPTDALQKLFEEVGVTSGEAAIQTFGLGGFLAILEEKTKGSTTELGELFGRIRAITGALVFSGEGLETFNENLAKIESARALEDFQRNTLLVLDNIGKRLDIEKERFANFFRVEVGRGFIDGLLEINDALGGFTEIARVIGRILSASFVPVVALLTVRMAGFATVTLRAAFATEALVTATVAFRRASIIIVGLAVAYEFLADSQESVVEQGQRLSKELAKNLAEQTAAQNKVIADSVAETGKLLNQRARLFNQPIAANILAPLNKAFADAQDGIEEFEKVFKLSTTQILAETKKLEGELEKAFQGFIDGAAEATESIEDLQTAFEKEVFEFQLEDQDTAGRISLITQRVEELNKIRREAVSTGDLEGFTEIQNELKALIVQRGELTDASQTGLDLEDRRAIKLQRITSLVEEEAKLRKDIAVTNEIQARAAEQIRVQQELANQDLKASFKLLTNTNFSDALAGGDETEIRRTLAEREAAAQRVVALQSELGVATRSNADIATGILNDRELAENRIAAARAASIVEEHQANQAFIKARLNAFETERQVRKANLDAELGQVSSLREVIAEQSRARLPELLGGGLIPESVGGIGIRDSTALTIAFGEAGAAQAEALIPVIDRLLTAQQITDPGDTTLRAIAADRAAIIEGLSELVASRGTADEVKAARQEQRDFFNAILAATIEFSVAPHGGQPVEDREFGDLPVLPGSSRNLLGDTTIQDIDEGFARIDATVAVFDQVLKNLSKSGGDLFKRQQELRASGETILELNRKLQDAQNINLNSTEKDNKQKDRLLELQEDLEGALQKDIEIRNRFTETFGDPSALGGDAVPVDEAFKAAQPVISEVFKQAIAAAQPQVVANAIKGEEAKQEITARSIRAELEARGKAAADESKRQEKIARLGPGAAERAALQAGTSGGARLKALAEARAEDREAKRVAARKIVDERIAAQKRFAEEAARQAGRIPGEEGEISAELAALRDLSPRTSDLRTQISAIRELEGLRDARRTDVDPVTGVVRGGIADPLGQAPGRDQQIDDGIEGTDVLPQLRIIATQNGELSTSLDATGTSLDLLNETMTVLTNSIIQDAETQTPITGAQFNRGDVQVTAGGDPRLVNERVGTPLEDFGQAGVELAQAFDELEAAEMRQAESAAVFVQQTAGFSAAINPINELLFPEFSRGLSNLIRLLNSLGIGPNQVGFAAGGTVPGSGNRDSIAAMLTPGEFVVRKSQAKRFMPQLLAMNSGRLRARGFQDGGPVDVGGIRVSVNESSSPQATARQVASEINRGIRQGTIRIRSR